MTVVNKCGASLGGMGSVPHVEKRETQQSPKGYGLQDADPPICKCFLFIFWKVYDDILVTIAK